MTSQLQNQHRGVEKAKFDIYSGTSKMAIMYLFKVNFACPREWGMHRELSLALTIGVAPITHMPNKSSNTQGSSSNVVEVVFQTLRNCS